MNRIILEWLGICFGYFLFKIFFNVIKFFRLKNNICNNNYFSVRLMIKNFFILEKNIRGKVLEGGK